MTITRSAIFRSSLYSSGSMRGRPVSYTHLMDIEPDLGVWKEYAIERGLHPAVLSFLDLRPERFYVMEPGHAGFVTGRAWEDLSEILLTMEELLSLIHI